MNLTSFGAADGVTGSKHLVDVAGTRILLDCGLFQGLKLHRERNWQHLPIDLDSIDAVVLSHAHLDHSGWLPVLVKHGYRGPIFTNAATRDLCAVMLADSAHLQEEDARRATRYGSASHKPALPLYTRADAAKAVARISVLAPEREATIGRVRVGLTPIGHLLGASAVTLQAGRERIVYSGDVGRDNDPPRGPCGAPTCCSSSRPTATAATRPRTCSCAWATSSAAPSGAVARCCCPPLRSAVHRPCCWCCNGCAPPATSRRRCRSSSTARWPSRPPS
jgi:Cft2 family RNA processing exonuclease